MERAFGLPTANGFLVKKGSQAIPSAVPSAQNYVKKMRLSLLNEGKFKQREDAWELGEDATFKSPTAAAAVLLGRSVNGRIKWKRASGQTLRQMQEANSGKNPVSYRWN